MQQPDDFFFQDKKRIKSTQISLLYLPMILNNSKSVINLKIARRASLIIFLAYLLVVYAARIIRFPLLGIDKTALTIMISAIFLIIMIVPQIFNYQYIYFCDEGESIIFRYYSAGLVPGKKNSVEINKRSFSGFTIDKKFLGLVESITLYQRLREGIAKYPPIYLTALKRADKARIIRSLNSSAPIIKG